jgi:hypothetical protein
MAGKLEIVDDDRNAVDSVAAWLALELEEVFPQHGKKLFDLSVPCRRKMVRPAEKRHVFVDGGGQVGGDDTSWDSPLTDGPIALDENAISGAEAQVVEREIRAAEYSYQCPRVLANLPPHKARWAYETFRAVELDAMYRLRDGARWETYVDELREGMEQR